MKFSCLFFTCLIFIVKASSQGVQDLARPFGRRPEVGLCTQTTNEGVLVRIGCLGQVNVFCCGFKGNENCCSIEQFVDSHVLLFTSIRIMLGICVVLFCLIVTCGCYVCYQVSGARSEEAARDEKYTIQKMAKYESDKLV